jgi:hypothetical protein
MEFEDLPHVGPGAYPRSKRLEFESEEGNDPLSVLWKTLTGMEKVATRLNNIDPILKSINIRSPEYVELGVDLMKEFGTPFVSLRGQISRGDVMSVDDEDKCESIDDGQPSIPL